MLCTQLKSLPKSTRADAEEHLGGVASSVAAAGVITQAQMRAADPKDVVFSEDVATELEAFLHLDQGDQEEWAQA